MKKIADQAFIIFGASGDLTYRKLIPALFDLYINGSLPERYVVLGVSRSEFSNEGFREKVKEGIKQYSYHANEANSKKDDFLSRLFYISIDTDKKEEYAKIKEQLEILNREFNFGENYIFYLSTPPLLYSKISKYLYRQQLTLQQEGFRRVIIEKPFGHDLESAIGLNQQLLEYFKEDQIFRIDHYLGKETVQNLIVTRFANSIYEPLWNKEYIRHIEITSAESLGIEERGGFYDRTGAMRDMIQNHLLQIVALVAMEPPAKINAEEIHKEKMKVFRSLRPLSKTDLSKNIIRGQYTAATIGGIHYNGYRDAANVNKLSRTETYVAMKIYIDNRRWQGIPFYIRTGKRLPTNVAEVVIHFKPSPQKLFKDEEGLQKINNQLILRIQPDEGIMLRTAMKIPGSGYEVKSVNMDFHYSELNEHHIPSAYERLLLDSMLGDSMLFMKGEAIEATWRFVQPILNYWEENGSATLYGYPSGSWGPNVAYNLIDGGISWRYPCKNLTEDGQYCEL